MSTRVAIVALRLPVRVRRSEEGVRVVPTVGGVATGLTRAVPAARRIWIGWPGTLDGLDPESMARVTAELDRRRLVPVVLKSAEASAFYAGYPNRVLWPAFHSMPDKLPLRIDSWPAYESANATFASVTLDRTSERDLIWVHDYQLLLVPELIRTARPSARISCFLHIPFPPYDIFRLLPQGRDLLTGMLGADQVAFHTADYRANFAHAVRAQLGLRVSPDNDSVRVRGRTVRLEVAPMGIHVERFERLSARAAANGTRSVHRGTGEPLLLVGVDRLDYTKGIPRRLLAFEELLRRHVKWQERVVFVQVAVPSRTHVDEYHRFASETAALVGRINGEFGTSQWTPIHYITRPVSQSELVGLFRAARAAVVTPIRDGMNLVSKEFVASRIDEDGVLVLSELAGAATELVEALIVNPYDVTATADTLHQALSMTPTERKTRMRALRVRVRKHDVSDWAGRLLDASPVRRTRPTVQRGALPEALLAAQQARHLLLLLDYDGTLVPFVVPPEAALPSPGVRRLLRQLNELRTTTTYILSGRDREFLERALGATGVGLVAEHGGWVRPPGRKRWQRGVGTSVRKPGWRQEALRLMRDFEDGTPGARIEHKSLALVWHWRGVSAAIGIRQSEELALQLRSRLPESADILIGDHIIEVRPRGVDKGAILARIRASTPRGAAVIAIGDDATDEDLFRGLEKSAVTIKVGTKPTAARFSVPDVSATLELLSRLRRDVNASRTTSVKARA
jgi:trehalose 6-phosphate synthase/phosphatase